MGLLVWNKKSTFNKLLQLLEDPRYPSVGPNLRLLRFTGLWRHNPGAQGTKFKQIIFYIVIMFFISQYIKCIIKFDSDSLKLILQFAPFHMGVVKTCFFQKYYMNWRNLIEYMSSQERKQLEKRDNDFHVIIMGYIWKSRRVIYFFWGLAFFSNFSIFTEPYQKNQFNENGTSVYLNIFDGYTPFSEEPPGYYMSMAIQTVLGHIMSAYVVGWDTLVVTIMIFFAGQLKISRMNCAKIIEEGNPVGSHRNIADCHKFHTGLVEQQKIFNSLISHVMFFYLIVISVNLGVCIIQIAETQDDLGTLVSSCVFIVACLIQLLLFYWFSNEVTVQSELISYGTFESHWFLANKGLQKEVALLGLTTRKRLVFRAGPFNEMSLATFVAEKIRSHGNANETAGNS